MRFRCFPLPISRKRCYNYRTLQFGENTDIIFGFAGQRKAVKKCRGIAQPGRALRSGRRGRRFESSFPDQPFKQDAQVIQSLGRLVLLRPCTAQAIGVDGAVADARGAVARCALHERNCGSCERGGRAGGVGADLTAAFAPAGAPTQTATLPTHVGATEGANGGGQADREERRLRLQAGRRDAPPFASCSGCCAWASGSARAGRRSGRSQRRQGLPIRRSARPAPRRASCGHRRRACGCFPCRTAGCPHPRSRKPCCAS